MTVIHKEQGGRTVSVFAKTGSSSAGVKLLHMEPKLQTTLSTAEKSLLLQWRLLRVHIKQLLRAERDRTCAKRA